MRSDSIRSMASAPGRVLFQIGHERAHPCPSAGEARRPSADWARNRRSNTRSAVRDMPRAKAKEAIVSTGWSESLAVAASELVAELGGREVGGVEHCVGRCTKRACQLALARDAVFRRTVRRERMPAAGLVIASDELRLRRNRDRGSPARSPGSNGSVRAARPVSKPRLRTSIPTATVSGTALALAMHKLLKQVRRQIVDDVPTHVLERVEHRRLARAGHAGDEQQARQSAALSTIRI